VGPIDVANRFVELWYAPERLDELRRLLADGYVHHTPSGDVDLDGFLQGLAAVNAALSEIDYRVVHAVVDGDTVGLYVTVEATHSGEFFGIAATGKRVFTAGACFLRVAEETAAEDWDAWALHSILFQLRAG
jgi:predicted ester cyclase